MTREFLEELQLSPEAAEAVLQAHEKAVQSIRFEQDLDAAIGKLRGRNAKAIKALLDLPALQENPDELHNALQTLKKENGYLFEPDTPPVYARSTGSQPAQRPAPATLAGALKEKYEKRR